MAERTCTVDGCDGEAGRPGTARGMCSKHYQRWRRGATPPDVNECAACGSDISDRRSDARYCSGACRQRDAYAKDPQRFLMSGKKWAASNRESVREYQRENMRKRRAMARQAAGPRFCAHCGADISHRDLSTRHCSKACWQRASSAARPPRPRHCEGCGADISHRGGKAKYCSKRCGIRVRYRLDPQSNLARQRGSKARVRAKVFGHFGTACVQCGSGDDLHLDHVNQDGKEHRDLLRSRGIYQSGEHFYRHLIKVNFDTDGYELQVLCGPCNRGRKHSMNTTPAG